MGQNKKYRKRDNPTFCVAKRNETTYSIFKATLSLKPLLIGQLTSEKKKERKNRNLVLGTSIGGQASDFFSDQGEKIQTYFIGCEKAKSLRGNVEAPTICVKPEQTGDPRVRQK